MKIAKSNRKLFLSIRPVFQMGLTVLISVLIISTIVKAGTIVPPSGGGEPSAKFYTISEIYNFITANTAATEGTHSFAFSDNLEGTGRTLTEIYTALSGLISADKVKLGTTYLNVSGTLVPSGGTAAPSNTCTGLTFYGTAQADWNLQTGSLNPAAGTILNGTTICGVAGTVIPNPAYGDNSASQVLNTAANPGTYDVATCTSNYNTLNLSAGTVKTGTAFGNSLTGEYPSASYPLSGAIGTDAIAGDIRNGLDAWNKTGAHIAGTMPTRTLSAASETVNAGYYDATTLSAVDTDLAVGNIKSGTTIFGILGTLVAYLFGDNDASKVLTTATGVGTYNAANLSTSTVKKGTAFGVSSTGVYSGFPGTGWTPNGSGDGSTALTQAICESQGANWKWFEDANGDGDTNDSEDGICIKTATVTSDSWNGAEQMNAYALADTIAASGTSNSATVAGTPWVADRYKNEIVKIISGTASPCWGIVKTNTNNTITVYGSWLQSTYAACAASPDATSHIQVFVDNMYDNSFIGDYSCSGNFPSGSVTLGSYPTSGTIALAVADCYDGKRDILPAEQDRAVLAGTATSADATSITDSAQTMSANVWLGQKVLITGGTGNGSSGIVESNTTMALTVASWSGTAPAAGSTFKIIYILPRASYVGAAGLSQIIGGTSDDVKANQGPLMEKQLKEWTGTKLPTSQDFFGFCGAASGSADNAAGNSSYSASGASANKTLGNYGSNAGRGNNASPNDEYMNLSNSGSWEWLSEQHKYVSARIAGSNACSNFNVSSVYYSYRFRAVFRP